MVSLCLIELIVVGPTLLAPLACSFDFVLVVKAQGVLLLWDGPKCKQRQDQPYKKGYPADELH
jgi:hypothetical protein